MRYRARVARIPSMASTVNATKKDSTASSAKPPPQGGQDERRESPVVPVASIVVGVLVAWRAWPSAAGPVWALRDAAGVAIGIIVSVGGILGFLLRSVADEYAAPFSRTRPWLGAAIALAAAGEAFVDLEAGRSALALVVGCSCLGLLYWDRPLYLFSLLAADAAAGAAAAFLAIGTADPTAFREELCLAVVAAALGAASAFAVRRVVAPGVERLHSLERENRELWDLSFRDGLTGLYNRRFAQETGRKVFARASRYHERLHVLMIDIDHFKRVNDKVSHAAGDATLRGIAEILVSCVRSSDIVARYGGEEFMVFLIEAEPETAQFIANRIRDDVAAHRFEEVPWQVTISIGVAGLAGDESLEALVDRADKHLYVAKRSGRNRVAGF